MVLIFRIPGHKALILGGRKTATRRVKEPRFHEGSVQPAVTRLYEKPFARLHIERIYQQHLGEMTEADAWKEGEYTLEQFRRIWTSPKPEGLGYEWDPNFKVWVIEFGLFEKLDVSPGGGHLNDILRRTGYGV